MYSASTLYPCSKLRKFQLLNQDLLIQYKCIIMYLCVHAYTHNICRYTWHKAVFCYSECLAYVDIWFTLILFLLMSSCFHQFSTQGVHFLFSFHVGIVFIFWKCLFILITLMVYFHILLGIWMAAYTICSKNIILSWVIMQKNNFPVIVYVVCGLLLTCFPSHDQNNNYA